jgi:aminopeptidase N
VTRSMRNSGAVLIFVISFFCGLSCKKPSAEIEKGVSIALNNIRKKSIDSIHYAIELDIPATKKERIRGKEKILFRLNSLDYPLVLDFNVDSAAVIAVRKSGQVIPYVFQNEHIVIEPEFLQKGKNELEIDFIAGDQSLNRSEEYLYTLFVPDRASTCFPLFDQPNLKATYALSLKTPADWEAVSNGLLIQKVIEGSKTIYQFEKTKPISSYLFAFAAGRFFKATQTHDGREMTMYYRETDTVKVNRNLDEVFSLHAKSLAWLEKYTGITYPFGKFDFVLIPSFQYGGMEHPGSIFYNESSQFLDENASVNRRMARASVIAHESAHMWFGDLVTMDWFNDVWLKEVFANFMAAKIVHPSFPEINHDLRFLLAHYPAAYEVDRSSGTNPILQDLGNLKNAGTLYGAIIYQKAPIVMRKLESMIGKEKMQESLSEYLKTYSFGNAKWDDLIRIIDSKTELDIAGWSQVWVKTSGMPEYDLRLSAQNLQIEQKRDSVANRIWQQPLAVKRLDKETFTDSIVQMAQAKPVVLGSASTAILFPNADGTGYGYFKTDSASRHYFLSHYDSPIAPFTDPVFRGSMLVNMWEGFLRGDGGTPVNFLSGLCMLLPQERNPLMTDYLLGNLQTTWWSFLTDPQRMAWRGRIEALLWNLMENTTDKGIKMSYFRVFKNITVTQDGLKKLRALWDGTLVVKGLVLAEDDKISLAYELALKEAFEPKLVLNQQLALTKNPDRRQRMLFVIPALSHREEERDAFFNSLKKPENREKEAWVLDALSYLHHPLRQKSALKYLRPSLELLQEIQLTGDIFFPTRWTNTTFSGHSSPEAAAVAAEFLHIHPDYPFFLKNKILQATDMLNRSVALKK